MAKNEKKFKFNIIDFVVILIIIAAIALAAMVLKPRLFGSSESAKTKTEIITIELAKQKEYMTHVINEGETVYDAISNTVYGKLISFDVKPATEIVVSETDGMAKTVEIPERYDIYINIEASTNSTSQVGKLETIFAKSFKGSGYVVGIERELTANEAAVETVEQKGATQQ